MTAPRIFIDAAFTAGTALALPAAAARHVKVLRMQPGQALGLFNGRDDAEWPAVISSIGRAVVEVQLGAAVRVDLELPWAVTIALGVPANDRMDALVEKAGELGATTIQPLLCERSVVRLAGERADARRRHWRGVATAASEQCGRARITDIEPVHGLDAWLVSLPPLASRSKGSDGPSLPELHSRPPPEVRIVLSFAAAAVSLHEALATLDDVALGALAGKRRVAVLSGPEGGLTANEEAAAVAAGFTPVSLGPRVLRADTAPLAVLAALGLAPTVP